MDGGPLTDNVVFVSVQRVFVLKLTAELLAHSMWRCDVDFDLRYRNSDFFREELILLLFIV